MLSSSVNPPHTYAEWVTVLDMLKDKTDDEAVLQAMLSGTIEWQSGVAERFMRKLIDSVNHRMNIAKDRFQRDMNHSNGQERIIVQALLSLRKELKFLSNAINLPAIPERERQQYRQLVIDQANEIQRNLEDSAKHDRTGKLLSILRNNRINAF